MNSALLPGIQRIMLSLAVVMSSCLLAQAQNEPLKQLRVDYALRFLEPAPHMALAKYFLDNGNRLQAFDILEAARRSRFEESVFNQAFQLAFRGFDYSSAAETALLKELVGRPRSEEVIFKLADLYIARSNWARAKRYLAAGIRIRPDDFKFTNGLAAVLRIEGNKEEADRLIKDYVRRYPESEAAVAFKIEGLIQTEPARAKSMTLEARAKFPKSGGLAFDLARILHGEGKLSEAEQLFVEAADLSPNSPDIQAWTGRFFFKVRGNKPRALDYYLNAYFLNPHTYETEFVESRIAKLSGELAEAEIEGRTKAGIPIDKLLGDINPAIVALVLEQISENWKPTYLEAVIKCLDHDDGGVRWTATEAIKKNADRTIDAKIRALLTDSDLRKRGLAAYLAVHLWQKESFPIIKRMLTEESQLLRFDAVSALILEGGAEGRRIAYEHAANEPNPTLKKMIESSRQGKNNGP
ncbi:MAG TPA: tetratricopeptide repeat protein [Pyrinomonadaceae bacterium]|nr:tetratricopeptide repeat protein [Pyrinomonadaceae bacterium]